MGRAHERADGARAMKLDLPVSRCEDCQTPATCRVYGCELSGSSEDSEPLHTTQEAQRYARRAVREERRRLLAAMLAGAVLAVIVALGLAITAR